VSDFFGDLLTGISTPQGAASLTGGLLSAGANIGSALIKSNATQNAINTLQGNEAQGEGFIDTGVNQYGQTIAPLMNQQPIELPQYRDLTTQQQLGETNLQRQNQAALAASGLRGAGWSGISSLENSNQQYEAAARAGNDATNLAAMQQAQQVQNQARTGLANVQAAAGTAKANTAIGVGSQIANAQNAQGVAQGSGLTAAAGNLTPTIGTIATAGANPNSAAANLNASPSVTASGTGGNPNAVNAGVPLAAIGGDPNSGAYGVDAGSLGMNSLGQNNSGAGGPV
jgi:hypothetical protein